MMQTRAAMPMSRRSLCGAVLALCVAGCKRDEQTPESTANTDEASVAERSRSAYALGRWYGESIVALVDQDRDAVQSHIARARTHAERLDVPLPAPPSGDNPMTAFADASYADTVAKHHGVVVGQACRLGLAVAEIAMACKLPSVDLTEDLAKLRRLLEAAKVPSSAYDAVLTAATVERSEKNIGALAAAIDAQFEHRE